MGLKIPREMQYLLLCIRQLSQLGSELNSLLFEVLLLAFERNITGVLWIETARNFYLIN